MCFATLSGCVTHRIVDTQVNSVSQLAAAPGAGATWAFERLPLQQQLQAEAAARQSQYEAMAAQAMAAQGFAAAPSVDAQSKPAYTLQMSVRIQRVERYTHEWFTPWGWHGWDRDDRYTVNRAGHPIRMPALPRFEPPWYLREVSLVLRDAQSKSVVFESQAKHDGVWTDDAAVIPAMLSAALQGFPKPPQGPRMVNIEIPR